MLLKLPLTDGQIPRLHNPTYAGVIGAVVSVKEADQSTYNRDRIPFHDDTSDVGSRELAEARSASFLEKRRRMGRRGAGEAEAWLRR